MNNFWKQLATALGNIGELICVSLIFVAVALLAFSLGSLIHWMELNGAHIVLVYTLKVGEWAITALDVYALVRRVWRHLFS